MLMVLISQSMFIVAVPAIRGAYPIEPDSVSWAVIVYTLTFMMFMPTYGRLGDALGKRRLLSGTTGCSYYVCVEYSLSWQSISLHERNACRNTCFEHMITHPEFMELKISCFTAKLNWRNGVLLTKQMIVVT